MNTPSWIKARSTTILAGMGIDFDAFDRATCYRTANIVRARRVVTYILREYKPPPGFFVPSYPEMAAALSPIAKEHSAFVDRYQVLKKSPDETAFADTLAARLGMEKLPGTEPPVLLADLDAVRALERTTRPRKVPRRDVDDLILVAADALTAAFERLMEGNPNDHPVGPHIEDIINYADNTRRDRARAGKKVTASV